MRGTTGHPVRVLVADDDPLFAEALAIQLALDDGIDVVGIAHDGAEACSLCAVQRPDVVLMDLHMPVLDGLEATRRIAREHLETRVLILSSDEDLGAVDRSVEAGAARFLTKRASLEEVRTAVLGGSGRVIPLHRAV